MACVRKTVPFPPDSQFASSSAAIYLGAIIRRDWRSFLFAALGSGIAALIATFQFAVFTSFLSTAYAVPRFLNGDVWLTGRGVDAFDFPFPIAEDYGAVLASRFPESTYRRVLFRFAAWEDSTGDQGNVAVVGIDDSGIPKKSFYVDESEIASMNLDLNRKALMLIGDSPFWEFRTIDSLATFLGIPYVLTSMSDARDVLAFPEEQASFIVINTTACCAKLAQIVAGANSDFPEITVLTDRQFSKRTATYWMTKTGAGAAISLSAVLAAVIMMIFLVTGISRFCQRYYNDFITLIGLGYDHRIVRRLTLLVAVFLLAGSLLTAVLLLPVVEAITLPVVPWVDTKAYDLVFGALLASVASFVAWFAVSKQVKKIELVDVFR